MGLEFLAYEFSHFCDKYLYVVIFIRKNSYIVWQV